MSPRSNGVELMNDHKNRRNAVPAERSFAFFCRRVCQQCNGTPGDTTAQLLAQCPVIRLDAFIYLRKENSVAKVAVLMGAAITEVITPELIACVNIVQPSDLRKPKGVVDATGV